MARPSRATSRWTNAALASLLAEIASGCHLGEFGYGGAASCSSDADCRGTSVCELGACRVQGNAAGTAGQGTSGGGGAGGRTPVGGEAGGSSHSDAGAPPTGGTGESSAQGGAAVGGSAAVSSGGGSDDGAGGSGGHDGNAGGQGTSGGSNWPQAGSAETGGSTGPAAEAGASTRAGAGGASGATGGADLGGMGGAERGGAAGVPAGGTVGAAGAAGVGGDQGGAPGGNGTAMAGGGTRATISTGGSLPTGGMTSSGGTANTGGAGDTGGSVGAAGSAGACTGDGVLGDPTAWAMFDVTTVNAGAAGFLGGVFDGRYVYLVPYRNRSVYDGIVARYDTEAPLDADASWETFDVSGVDAGAAGFYGGVFDGRYVYLVPNYNGSTYDGIVARYDTQAPFDEGASWDTFDVSGVNAGAAGFVGGVFDGRYVYLVPNYNGSASDGIVPRYDTQAPFDAGASWATFDVTTVNAAANAFGGSAFDGRYIYLVHTTNGPVQNGLVARYDTRTPFEAGASWATFDVATVNSDARSFLGASFDGRYVYFAPTNNNAGAPGIVARYDTRAAFDAGTSWATFDMTTVNAGAKGFDGTTFDGRYVYFVPFGNALTRSGLIARYDTQGQFDTGASWTTFDMTTVNAGAKGFVGAVFDGRYVYLVPNSTTGSHSTEDGLVARFDARGATCTPTLPGPFPWGPGSFL